MDNLNSRVAVVILCLLFVSMHPPVIFHWLTLLWNN